MKIFARNKYLYYLCKRKTKGNTFNYDMIFDILRFWYVKIGNYHKTINYY